MEARSGNGVPIRSGDEIQLVGEFPENPVVGYAGDMKRLLNDGKFYKIKNISNMGNGQCVIEVGGWNWDTRNIFKKGKDPIIHPDPVVFPENLLDV